MNRLTDPTTGIAATANSPAGGRFLCGLVDAIADDRQRTEAWTRFLVARGVTLAHPDDGWVDRVNNTVHFAYPTLMAAEPKAGALVALGTHERWRVVELVSFTPWLVDIVEPPRGRWSFRPVSP